MTAAHTGLFARPYLLLILTAWIWAGNAVVGRLLVGEASPMAVVTLRWAIALSGLWLIARHDVRAHWPELKRHWLFALLMGALGFTAFNALFYVAAHYTAAINIAIIQGAMPALMLVGTFLAYGVRIRLVQTLGVMLTLAGVTVLAAQGDWRNLASLSFNLGDVFMMFANLLYAGYAVGLRNRPAVPGLVFFTAMAAAAFLTSLPLLAAEIALGAVQCPTVKGWALLVFVGLGPSFAAQIFFMRGVDLIGPGRAGVFVNLVPVFGAILAVVVIGEPFRIDHLVALALVLGGIWIAERRSAGGR